MRIGSVITRICWGFLSALFIFITGRGHVLIVRAETTTIKRRMRAHSTRQLDRVYIAHAVKSPEKGQFISAIVYYCRH